MNIHNLSYMRWAKCHRRVRFELTGSGVASLKRHHLDTAPSLTDFEARGTYGDPDLIGAIATRYGVDNARVIPVPGASTGIFLALATATRTGDSILVEDPAYDPIVRAARVLGLNVLPLPRPATRDFAPDPSDICAGLTSGARAVFLTQLHNPSGQWLNEATLRAISAECRQYNATLIIDEAYLDGRAIVRNEHVHTTAAIGENILAINTLTKVYGLSGLRIGWVIAGAGYVERAQDVMDVLSVNNAGPSMRLAVRAMGATTDLEEIYRTVHRAGQEIFRGWLAQEPRVTGYANQGAVFECIRLPAGLTSDAFNDLLTERFDTQVVPGSFFGLSDHVRISTVVEPEILEEGLRRLSAALTALNV
ncbi:MAG: pyridoxal phosphate-dependent aminotransferase [Phycisphaerae bacterium]|nr:pyridoxal phosphate-dependent aminotransferase [Phycisphaerae bacterium]